MKVGILGVGTITSAVVEGFIAANLFEADNEDLRISDVILSPRNEQKARDLCELCKSKVSIAHNNQSVVDMCDILIVGLHHKCLQEVFSEIDFQLKTTMKLVSITAVWTCEELHSATKGMVPLENIFRVCTLPMVKMRKGTSILYPANEQIFNLFSHLGSVMVCPTEDMFKSAMKPTCLMGDFYMRCGIMSAWLVQKGFEKKEAQIYIASLMGTIVSDATTRGDDDNIFGVLVKEQTPGGLNEKNIKKFQEAGAYETYKKVLDET